MRMVSAASKRQQNSVDFDSLDKSELVQLAREKGVNASTTWKKQTIINKLKGAS